MHGPKSTSGVPNQGGDNDSTLMGSYDLCIFMGSNRNDIKYRLSARLEAAFESNPVRNYDEDHDVEMNHLMNQKSANLNNLPIDNPLI
ncbi:uncharacterized protein ASCRUDRAFT_7352 [Ascoidea rubescens DSM 1968]|uniref:Uncharacterized protein n=1 Tax=Ascoidea rubescens DSM 1968 TaxID=1344418 RepID=A0A1D2VJU2_9ASCO|nr:hypothetical protein ASCRUDRAFT_7352 [Ascoidea rubescens DSM 1968]ODV61884.1 hypothetical protein ASCRUDRAFT_7352 [Ascoidea rubescens DSM 1968]